MLIRIYNATLRTFKIMMWAFAPFNTIETNKISGEFVGIPHDVETRSAPARSSRARELTEGEGPARGAAIGPPRPRTRA